MIRKAGDRLEVSGAMTLPGATTLLAEGNACLDGVETVFDLAAVTAVDSSGIAVIFGWLREAQRRGKSIHISHPPLDLLSLAEVYGVTELLPLV
ncbi:MAG TPA: STAS domain-containing protein [Rhodocyclaceae bacterium]|nr:STAS domain-containing protein [Rhodocyclaceae bacterium]